MKSRYVLSSFQDVIAIEEAYLYIDKTSWFLFFFLDKNDPAV